MIRVTVLYENKNGATFNWDYYTNQHLPMVRQKLGPLGLTKIESDRGLFALPPGTPAPYQTITHLYFDSLEAFQNALTQEAPGILADTPNFTDAPMTITVNEVIVH
jgi:uncharacterized protein (TIGR02118 family)